MDKTKAVFEFVALVGVLDFAWVSARTIITYRDFFALAWLFPYFSPHAYAILLFVGFYFATYRRWGWKAPFMFLVLYGVDNALFDPLYLLFHYPTLAASGWTAWPIDAQYPFKIAANFALLLVGIYATRPAYFRPKKITKIALGIYLSDWVVVLLAGFPVTLYPAANAHNLLLNLSDMVGLVTLPIILYTGFEPKMYVPSYLAKLVFKR